MLTAWKECQRFLPLFFAVLFAWDLLALAACIGDQIATHQADYHSAYDKQSSCLRCIISTGPIPNILRFFGSSDGFVAITAIATGFIAWFTYTLKLATTDIGTRQSNETRILQRAYISAEPEGVSPFQPPDPSSAPTNHIFVGHVGFRNAGRLPARNVRWYIEADCLIDPIYEPTRYGDLTGNNVISPGEAMTQGSIEKPIPSDRRGLYFYVWGKITYDDGFGNERKTIFCHRYNLRRLEREGPHSGFFHIPKRYGRHHNKGNDAT